MTNQSHTELAAQARRAVKSLEILDMDSTADLLRQCAAALESPERVLGLGWKRCGACNGTGDSPSGMLACEDCSGSGRVAAPTPPTAPAQDAQGVSAILDALRIGRVACEWAEKHDEVKKIAEAMDDARALLRPIPEVEGWRTIESVPKDYGITTFDVWARGERVADCWWGSPTYDDVKVRRYGVVHQSDYDSNGPVYSFVIDPAHWKPLPPPPSNVEPMK